MRVAVTGSHGFIGSSLVESLVADDHEVVQVAHDDVRAEVLEGTEAVVHLAGEPIGARRWTTEQKRRILHSRAETTATLATTLAALDPRPRVLLSGSAIGYYGELGDEVTGPIDETGV